MDRIRGRKEKKKRGHELLQHFILTCSDFEKREKSETTKKRKGKKYGIASTY